MTALARRSPNCAPFHTRSFRSYSAWYAVFSCALVRLSGMRDSMRWRRRRAATHAATRGSTVGARTLSPSTSPFRFVFVLEVGQSPPHVGGAPLTSYYTRPRCPNPDAQTRKVNEGVVGGAPLSSSFARPRWPDPKIQTEGGCRVFWCSVVWGGCATPDSSFWRHPTSAGRLAKIFRVGVVVGAPLSSS